MAAVGLLYVGVVLVINGLVLLGHITPRGAAPLNLFVGALQVITPTYLIVAADGDMVAISLAAGLYFFGFTYLWVGINWITGWSAEGLGWFSLTVTISALAFAWHSLVALDDRAFAVIWVLWAVLWFTFFLLMARDRNDLGPAIGVLAAGYGVLTAAVPGFLLVGGWWQDSAGLALVVAALGAGILVASGPLARGLAANADTTSRSERPIAP